jgi:hypothetical protein
MVYHDFYFIPKPQKPNVTKIYHCDDLSVIWGQLSSGQNIDNYKSIPKDIRRINDSLLLHNIYSQTCPSGQRY